MQQATGTLAGTYGEFSMRRRGTRPVAGVIVVAAALMVSSVSARAMAQMNTGEVAGLVRDSSGAALPGATVTATHAASGLVVERVTDAEGRFFLAALQARPVGHYRLVAWLRSPDAQVVSSSSWAGP